MTKDPTSPQPPSPGVPNHIAPRQRLWKHMSDEHDLYLLESEVTDIVQLALACQSAESSMNVTQEQLRHAFVVHGSHLKGLMRTGGATPEQGTEALQSLADDVFAALKA